MDFDMFSGALFPGFFPVMASTNLSIQARTATISRHPRRRHPLLLFVLVFAVVCLICEILRGYIISQALTLEQYFNTQLIVFEDIGYLATILFFGVYGCAGISNIPRFIGTSVVIYGSFGSLFGAFYLLLPVIGDNVVHDTTFHKASMCLPDQPYNRTCNQDGRLPGTGSSVGVVVVFAVMMMVQGAFQPVRFILGSPFIEHDAPNKTQATLYNGLLLVVNFFGRPLAYVCATLCNTTSTDNAEESKRLADPSWVGAWWIGTLTVIFAAPLCISTWGRKPLPGHPCTAGLSLWEKLKDLPRCVILLLSNCVFVTMLGGISCAAMFLMRSMDYEVQYIQVQFYMSAQPAYLITAVKLLFVLFVGAIAGAVIPALLRLNNKGCLKFATVAMTTALLTFALQLLLGCDNPDIMGLGEQRLRSPSADCTCDVTEYSPLCGGDGRSYISPCDAGCTNQTGTTYTGCVGIPGGEGVAGVCPRECPYLWYYIVADVVSGICAMASSVAVVQTIIRSMTATRRTMALALTGFFCCLVAWLSSTVIYRPAIASSCRIRDLSCGQTGACALYDLPSLRTNEKGIGLCLQGSALLMFIIAYLLHRSDVVHSPEKDPRDEDRDAEPVDL
ncbi:solute carrier organic anion transporter family member 74D-like [Haliotis rubra]|uniref:solute carrier organic anion transporter family member 74D-like n=1 Tax=Haliotis rubra TaxID=36100 RepID=UPI001EE57A1F|nr:solute carrier organic anion transporter family member 74D-like [Haliotis rubra]